MAQKRKPNGIMDIARVAGVSTATVSRVLNRNPSVKRELKERVDKAAKQLNYEINRRLPFNPRSVTVGVVVPDISNPWFPLLVKGIENTARIHGYAVALCDSDNDEGVEEKQLSALVERGVDGLIIIPTDTPTHYMAELVEQEYPLVFLDRDIDHDGANYVTSDNEEGAYQATKYLISLGHREIAYIGGPSSINTEPLRHAGYQKALREADIDPEKQVHVWGHYSYEKTRAEVRALLSRQPAAFTAVFASGDVMALGAREALELNGMRVPDDISLVGFDDIPFASLLGLTTISQPAFEMGKNALLLLNDVMKGRVEAPKNVILPTSIVIRSSCRRV
jgi:LacI family transcriptional regulator, galactose operon repressor